jgi:hypothetical protein
VVLALSSAAWAEPLEPALLDKFIGQLGSPRFAERQAATDRLRRLGEPAVDALRKAARRSSDLEVRRRAEQLAEEIETRALDKTWREGLRQEANRQYKEAAALFDKVVQKSLSRYHADRDNAPEGDIPVLTEIFLHVARVAQHLGDHVKAGNAYHHALYYANFNNEKRREIDAEWSAMTAKLLATWKADVLARVRKDPSLKALVARHPLVLLHSRRYADGQYLQSAYSFIYRTAQEDKHRNDVQLLFDNGGIKKGMFQINMVVGQKNAVAELKGRDFNQDLDPEKLAADSGTRWLTYECQARPGQVYLERVEDNTGTRFFVLFQVLAVDEDSRYVAFVWRRLPGGKIVERK